MSNTDSIKKPFCKVWIHTRNKHNQDWLIEETFNRIDYE